VIHSFGIESSMQNKPSINKNRTSNEENLYGYIPRKCDLKCYKCRHQGICIVPRGLIEAGKRSIRNNIFRNVTPLNNKYGLKDFLPILGYKKKPLRYPVAYNKKKKLYSKDSK